MTRTLIFKDNKIQKGKKEIFDSLVNKEMKKLKKIYEKMSKEDPEVQKIFSKLTVKKLREEARRSLISASHRFGCGEIWSNE